MDKLDPNSRIQAIRKGIDIGALKEGSRYDGEDEYLFEMTSEFYDIYKEKYQGLQSYESWDDALRNTLMELANKSGIDLLEDEEACGKVAALQVILKDRSFELKNLSGPFPDEDQGGA